MRDPYVWEENPELSRRRDSREPEAQDTAPNGKAGVGMLTIYDAADIDPAKIPPRAWLLGVSFCRKFLSGLIGEGGVGKTAIRYAQYLAGATGRKDITGEHVHHRFRTLIVCLEDDLDEVKRRLAAAMLHHRVYPEEIRGYISYCTPTGLKLLREGQRGELVIGELYNELNAAIEDRHSDLVGIDPFVKAHGVSENDNKAIDEVCTMLARLAAELSADEMRQRARQAILEAFAERPLTIEHEPRVIAGRDVAKDVEAKAESE